MRERLRERLRESLGDGYEDMFRKTHRLVCVLLAVRSLALHDDMVGCINGVFHMMVLELHGTRLDISVFTIYQIFRSQCTSIALPGTTHSVG